MIQLLVLSSVLVLLLLVLNAFINNIGGTDKSGEYGKVIEASLTIGILYLVIIGLFGSDLSMAGIPFIDELDNYESLTDIFKNNLTNFAVECAELISLTFIISLISNIIPGSWGGSGLTGKVMRSIALALAGVIANNYLLTFARQTAVFSWAITALQCFFSGASLVLTPSMLLGELLHLDPKSKSISFLVKKLPQTKIGKSISTATSNSLLLIFVIMIFESQFGSFTTSLNQVPDIISLFAPVVIMIAGIRLLIRQVSK